MFTWGVIKSVGYQLENIATRGHVPRSIYLFSLFQSQKRHQPTLICVLHSQLPPQGHTCGSILSRHGIRKQEQGYNLLRDWQRRHSYTVMRQGPHMETKRKTWVGLYIDQSLSLTCHLIITNLFVPALSIELVPGIQLICQLLSQLS